MWSASRSVLCTPLDRQQCGPLPLRRFLLSLMVKHADFCISLWRSALRPQVNLPVQLHQPLFLCCWHVAYWLHPSRCAVSKCYRDETVWNLDAEFKGKHGLNDGPEWRSRYSDSLRAGRSGDRIPVGDEIFRACPDRPWGPPSLLNNVYRVFPGSKAAGAWGWPPTPSNAEVKERVELYLYSTSGPSWPVIRELYL